MNSLKEVLYGGAAGGGKSVAQLMGALQYVDVPGYSAILFRKTYADLSLPGALIDMSKQWLMPFVDAKEIRWSEKDKKYTFPSGATLSFGYLENSNDCYRYQGAEFQYIGMDEVTHIDPANYRYLFSRLRRTKDLDVPLRFRATANPGGEFGEYYYQRFFVDGPEKGRVFIPAGLDDNPYLDDEAYREALNELDPIERERLLNGNWEIKQNGDLFSRHWFQIVPYDTVPAAAQRVRFWDLAATDPKRKKVKTRSGQREPDYTVGFKLAKYQGMYWVEDIYRGQITPKEAERVIKATAVSDGYGCAIRMEQEPGSSGAVTIDKYQREVLSGFNFLGVTSTGSKIERARSASAASEGGLVLVSDKCRHIIDFFDEADLFPYGMHDDTIDGFSGAFNYFRPGGVVRIPTAIKKRSGSYWAKFS
jgi:predicted phage terminase large subunit-like protein